MKITAKTKILIIISAICVTPLFYYAINFNAVNMGAKFLLANNKSENADIISKSGEYAHIYDLVDINISQRKSYIEDYARQLGLEPTVVPNSDGTIFISNHAPSYDKEKVLFLAHYDTYQSIGSGALDNLGSVSLLLSSMKDLKSKVDDGVVSFLFTSGEEYGLLGSGVFVDHYMDSHNLAFDLIVNLDCIGSGNPILVSSSDTPGLMINLFPLGERIFNGDELIKPNQVWKVDKADFNYDQFGVRYEPSIVGNSDTRSFLKNNLNAVHISADNMKSIMEFSHTSADQPEVLEQKYMEETKKVVLSIANNYKR